MVYFQQYYYNHHRQTRKVDETVGIKAMINEELRLTKRLKFKLLCLLCLTFLSCSFIWLSQIFGFPFSRSCILQEEKTSFEKLSSDSPIASVESNDILYCDRSHFRTDICFMKGDIRTHLRSSSIFLYKSPPNQKALLNFPTNFEEQELRHETIKPYTRKWETSIMNTIDQLNLISKHKPLSNYHHKCDVMHDVPAIFFSTGGYTGNVYHEFNDGIIPLYITSQHFNKEVIFVILEYHSWWHTKYGQILAQLSNYPLIDFSSTSKTHCFQKAIVGLKIHDELTIHSSKLEAGSSSQANILGFRNILSRAFEQPKERLNHNVKNKPKIVLFSRSGGSRAITNERSLVKLAQRIGFHVQILKPNRKTELGTMYNAISNANVMIGVHGAAMTHFLFLKPKHVLVQVIPLGTEWASETYYGEPAKKFGLKYIGYKIDPRESSLYYKHDKDDPILRDPSSVNKKGWEFTKRIYLDNQNLRLDLKRFQKLLISVYNDHLSNLRINTTKLGT